MDERRPDLRVSDRDRQAAAERLRLAMGEGRLDVVEYDDRLAKAYAAVTYADLEPLFIDLPPASAMALPELRPRPTAPPAPRPAPSVARVPTALKVLWTVWGAVVAINLTVWLIVSVTTGLTYFWPMWLAVPGAALFAVSAGVVGMRGERR
ncbi:DUF1707 SHOCT-like domain-containing protein [Petropleomorpha daqingensis]|uniref:DUF1707 domain-containing protein n=1 Tax=Petropleomorpha daqingensis TaxID=2026353 RepID=A0A853CR11_9ACTN|nr:DUF1707 domain-containing protein [Petropleomorpha daqingensis]NYJ08618.1 hypothetical protein [Petropleomorpha daqingensis]